MIQNRCVATFSEHLLSTHNLPDFKLEKAKRDDREHALILASFTSDMQVEMELKEHASTEDEARALDVALRCVCEYLRRLGFVVRELKDVQDTQKESASSFAVDATQVPSTSSASSFAVDVTQMPSTSSWGQQPSQTFLPPRIGRSNNSFDHLLASSHLDKTFNCSIDHTGILHLNVICF